MFKIDLHTHTTCSDGTFSPKELVELAYSRGFKTLSITDHDNIEALEEGRSIATEKGIEFIPGTEISCLYKGIDIHILGYYFDETHKGLNKMLHFIQNAREIRAKQMLEKLDELGMHLDFKELQGRVGNPNAIGRPHIAQMLVNKGYCFNVNVAFEKYIGDNSPAYLPKPSLHPKEVIATIHDAGGIAVIAHPAKVDDDFINLDLIEMGADGIETHYILHRKEQIAFYSSIAEQYGLINTGGSDFHGFEHQVADWGKFSVPEKCVQEMKEKHKEILERKRNE